MKVKILSFAMAITLVICITLIAQDSTLVQPGPDSQIKVSAFVDQKEVPLNRTFNLIIQISWSGSLDRYEIDEFENPVLRNLEIVGTSSSNRVTGGQNLTAIKEYEFTLKPLELGMGYIDPTVIAYNDKGLNQNQRLVTNRLEVKVTEALPEPGEDGGDWILPIVILVLAGGIVAAVMVIQRKRKERLAKEQEEAVLPVEENYLQELKTVIDLNDAELEVGRGFSNLSRFYRRFLAEKFDIKALENTSDEVISSLKDTVVDERFISSSQEILNTCDLAKFSGGTSSKTDLERVYTLIESNIERCRRDDLSGDKAEEDSEANQQNQEND